MNRKVLKTNSKIVNLIVISILLCSTLLTCNLFVDAIIYPKCAFILILIFTYAIFSGKILKCEYSIDALYICVFVFILYLLIHSFCFFSSCKYSFTCYLAGLFILYSFFYFNKRNIKTSYFHDSLCLTGIIQAITGIIQLLKHEMISGRSDNQTGLAISLICIFPFIYFHYRTITISWKKYIYVISLGLIALTVILSGCRTCIIALAVTASFIIFQKKHIVLLVGISLVLLLTVYYKKDSSRGRAFIYQTSMRMIDFQTLLIGKGHGGFKREYMKFQAKAFESNLNSRNAILADNVFHPLNEYILLLIEYGMIGCVLALMIGFLFFRYADRDSPSFLYVLILGIIACFSYPFRYPLTSVLLAYSLASVDCRGVCLFKTPKGFKTIVMFSAFLGILYVTFDIRNHYSWKKQITLCSLGKIEKTLPMYDVLYSSMNDNPYFLYNYSMVTHQLGNYHKSNDILLCCTRYLNDYDTNLLYADNCQALKQYNEAEYYYIHAAYMCPNRFQPLYQLMCLYIKTNKMEQARSMAETIVKKKIKVPSMQINKMIHEANSLLTTYLDYTADRCKLEKRTKLSIFQ